SCVIDLRSNTPRTLIPLQPNLGVLQVGSTFFTPATQETHADAKSVSDPVPLSYAKPQPPSKTLPNGSPGSIYQPGWGVTNNCLLDTPDACQDMVDHIVPPGYFSELRHLPNTDFLSQYNIKLARQVAMGSQLRLRFEQDVRLLKKATAKIARQGQRIQAREGEIKRLDQEIKSLWTMEVEVHGHRNRTKNLETLLEAEVDMKKAAEAKNAGQDKELESLRVQFSDLQVSNN
ncbi:hypothetical protein Tco_1288272, partial [Tanacetum coccineum]